MDLVGDLVAPFARMTPAEATTLLTEQFGVAAARLERLDTERDDSFRVELASGEAVLLKVAHPDDDAEVIAMQLAAMRHVAAAGLPVQRVLGGPATVGGRVARLLSWLPGTLAREHAPSAEQLVAAGRMLGRLSAAMADFAHPAASRALAWDLQHVGSLPPTDATAAVIERFRRVVGPALAGLPHQVIHNDFHPGNLLVDPAHPDYIVGILDFGDVVHSARVCDLGVALAYLSPGTGTVLEASRPFVAGFDAVTPLLDAEKALIPDLVTGRLVQRMLLNSALSTATDRAVRNPVAPGTLVDTAPIDDPEAP
jgi:Ser/Thr protein kinase RdoA (MazF antagonist)